MTAELRSQNETLSQKLKQAADNMKEAEEALKFQADSFEDLQNGREADFQQRSETARKQLAQAARGGSSQQASLAGLDCCATACFPSARFA